MSRAASKRATRLSTRCLLSTALAALLAACAPEPGEATLTPGPGPEASAEVSVSREELRLQLNVLSLRPLSQEPVPQMVGGHIVNQKAAVRLGKALFWDMQAGSDGKTACASCHFNAGADDRLTNAVNPGLDGIFQTGGVTGPGQVWTPERITSDDRIGSSGVFRGIFQSFSDDPTVAEEQCRLLPAAPFHTERQVGFRHSPSVLGSGFYRNQFWGGEANVTFNGVNHWGDSGNNFDEPLTNVQNASLASQALGPILNFTEMTCFGRPNNGEGSLGAKLLARTPLQLQHVAPDDSVLGPLANPNGKGLRCGNAPCTYGELITAAFGPELGAQAQDQFTVIWGEALAAYQATLIPDQTPLDRFLSGRLFDLTPRQVHGLATFAGKGGCVNCHVGAMLSDATVSWYEKKGPLNRDGGDQGFHNIGLRPSDEDLARGDLGVFGGVPNSVSGSPFDRGAFKTPTLRNVKLTAPYFHTGGYPTLEEVVDFYARGGDFENPEKSKDIVPIDFTQREREALVDFMANALTDCRVEKQRAPFDHPELHFPNRATLPATGRRGLGHCP